MTPVRPLTATGVVLFVVVPSPNSPSALCPQARTVPLLRSARACDRPAETAITLLRPVTVTGDRLLVVVPLPSSPKGLHPHARTVPSLSTAKLKSPPAAMAFTP